jgi:hypothetical protein
MGFLGMDRLMGVGAGAGVLPMVDWDRSDSVNP